MNNRLWASTAVLLLVVGFFLGQAFVPETPAIHSEEAGFDWMPLNDKSPAVYRINRETGEVTAFVLYKGELLEFKTDSPSDAYVDWMKPAATPKPTISEDRWKELLRQHGAEWGLDPETGRVVDRQLYYAALERFGVSRTDTP